MEHPHALELIRAGVPAVGGRWADLGSGVGATAGLSFRDARARATVCAMSEIRLGAPADDPTLIAHFVAMWTDLGTPVDAIVPEASERIAAFVAEARADYDFASFHAVEGGGVVGTACCQRYRAPYPDILTPQRRLYGYIWGVYVEPSARRRGHAKRLTTACLDHLRAIGCSRAILNASPPGERVYRALGFEASNERYLDLT